MLRQKLIGFIKLSLILVIIITAIRYSPVRIYYNHTHSMRVGAYLYVKQFSRSSKGDVVAACISDTRLRRLALERKYVEHMNSSPCRDKSEVIVKNVIGVAGDIISIHNGYIFINNHMVMNSNIHQVDSHGRYLPHFQESIIPAQQYFLLGETNDSFDSRYFGLISESDILGNVYYIKDYI